MFKRMLCTGLAALSLTAFPLTVFADSGVVSPGLNVIASGLSMHKTGLSDQTLTFTAEEFEAAVGVSRLKSITVLSLPDSEAGTLCISSTPVMKNQVISRKALSELNFVPKEKGSVTCSFEFGVVSSSQPLAFECMVSLVPGLNFAPTVELPESGYLSASTLAGIPFYGRLAANDPEGDRMTFRITDFPKKGTITVSDRHSGDYVYTPLEGYVGSDSFRYVAIDACGNRGKEVTVALDIGKNNIPVRYCDLDGNRCELAAYRLAEDNLVVGRTIGGKTYFDPDGEMSRAEFLALVMCIDGREIDLTETSTSFQDDEGIPGYLRAYVCMAEKEGLVRGTETEAGSYFYPNRTVTRTEAGEMIAAITDCSSDTVTEVMSLLEGGETEKDGSLTASADAEVGAGETDRQTVMNRSDAAILLCELMDRMDG